MPDYSKAIIYTIRSGDSLYVGSTTSYAMRKHRHRHDINTGKQLKLYDVIIENKGEWDMKPYSEFPCENKIQLNIEEERVRRELNADLNMIKCHRTKEELIKYTIEQNKNKDLEKERNRAREHRKNNPENEKEAQRKYREQNRLERLAKGSEKIKCECGYNVRRDGIGQHRKTKIHMKLMKTI